MNAPRRLLLLHYFICSAGLLKAVSDVSWFIFHLLLNRPLTEYNAGAAMYFFIEKPYQLIFYVLAVPALMLYYASAYVLLRESPGRMENFFSAVERSIEKGRAYGLAMLFGNLLGFGDRFLPDSGAAFVFHLLAAAAWLAAFSLPFYFPLLAAGPQEEARLAALER